MASRKKMVEWSACMSLWRCSTYCMQYFETPRPLRIFPSPSPSSLRVVLVTNLQALSWTPVALRLTDACTHAALSDDSPPPRPPSSTAGLSVPAQSAGFRYGFCKDKEMVAMQTNAVCNKRSRPRRSHKRAAMGDDRRHTIGPDLGQASHRLSIKRHRWAAIGQSFPAAIALSRSPQFDRASRTRWLTGTEGLA